MTKAELVRQKWLSNPDSKKKPTTEYTPSVQNVMERYGLNSHKEQQQTKSGSSSGSSGSASSTSRSAPIYQTGPTVPQTNLAEPYRKPKSPLIQKGPSVPQTNLAEPYYAEKKVSGSYVPGAYIPGRKGTTSLDDFKAMENTKWTNTVARAYNEDMSDYMHSELDKLLSDYTPEQGQRGWEKYQSDQKKQEKGWFAEMMAVMGSSTDASLPLANVSQVTDTYRRDTSFAEPNKYWTEEEKLLFGQLYLHDQQAANSYSKAVSERHRVDERQKNINELEQWSSEHKILGGAASVGNKMIGITDSLDMWARNAAGGYDATSEVLLPTEAARIIDRTISTELNDTYGTIHEDVPDLGGKGWGDAYLYANEALYDVTSTLTMGPVGKILPLAGTTYANSYYDAIEQGATEDDALLHASAASALEVVSELVSNGTLPGKNGSKIKNYVGKEALEAGVFASLSPLLENMILDDRSSFQLQLNAYMEEGMSRHQAYWQTVMDYAEDAVLSSLSSGLIDKGFHLAGKGFDALRNIPGGFADSIGNASSPKAVTDSNLNQTHVADTEKQTAFLNQIATSVDSGQDNPEHSFLDTSYSNQEVQTQDAGANPDVRKVTLDQSEALLKDLKRKKEELLATPPEGDRASRQQYARQLEDIQSQISKVESGLQAVQKKQLQRNQNQNQTGRDQGSNPASLRQSETDQKSLAAVSADSSQLTSEMIGDSGVGNLEKRGIQPEQVLNDRADNLTPDQKSNLKLFESQLNRLNDLRQQRANLPDTSPEVMNLDKQIIQMEQTLNKVENSKSMQPLQTQIAEIRNRDTNVQNVIENSGSDGIMEINKQTSEFEQNGEYGSSIRFDQILTDGSHMENGVLKPNVTYQSGEFGYLYHTNSDGVVDQVFVADLYMKEHNGRLPYNSATLDKQAGDHAGHLIADSFGGSPKLDNLVSQYSKVNQGDYRKMELLWNRAIKAGNQVSIFINLDYTNGSKRPEGFHISYMIDGELHYQYISNTRRAK